MVIYKNTKYYVHKNTNMFSPNLRHLINFEIIYFSYIFLFHSVTDTFYWQSPESFDS